MRLACYRRPVRVLLTMYRASTAHVWGTETTRLCGACHHWVSSERTAGAKARYARPRLAPAQGNYQIAYMHYVCVEGIVKLQQSICSPESCTDPQGSWTLRLIGFVDKRHMKVTRWQDCSPESWTDPQGSWTLRLAGFVDKRHMKVTRWQDCQPYVPANADGTRRTSAITVDVYAFVLLWHKVFYPGVEVIGVKSVWRRSQLASRLRLLKIACQPGAS